MTGVRRHALALTAYVLLTLVFAWPLPAHLGSALTGPVAGDTGVYVWNVWVFSHEVLGAGQMPLSTTRIFSLDRPADLSLHNYTVLADLAALPLIPLVGVVAAFNLVYLAVLVASAYAMFLLAWHLCRHPVAAWLAGALLACSPMIVARSTGHFSLVNVAPLPLFALLMLRAGETGRWGYAVGAGAALTAAAYADPYYAIYCLLLGLLYVAHRTFTATVVRRPASRHTRVASRVVESLGLVCLLLVAWIVASGGREVAVAGVRIRMQTLYTPVFVLTGLILARVGLAWSVRIGWNRPLALVSGVRLVAIAGLSSAVLMSPLLLALAVRIWQGRYVAAPVFWRSSMPGVDLLALVTPNPSHPLFGDLWHTWLAGRPGGFAENTATLPFTALATLVLAFRRRLPLPRFWLGVTFVFLLLALGPFVRVAGVDTCIPTPWTLLRYVPIVGAARAPTRFMAVAMMGLAALFAVALAHLLPAPTRHVGPASRRSGRARQWLVGGAVATALLFELLPAPRRVYSAEVPSIYARIAADPRPVRVLELPTGIRDGLSSTGNFSPSTQFYQTVHHKRLIGGYLSRVTAARVAAFRALPIRSALIDLSEGRPVSPDRLPQLRRRVPEFMARAALGYVVIDRSRATPALADFAIRLFDLEELERSGSRTLYRPRRPSSLQVAADAAER